MRAFVLLSCVVCFAVARPQYNYSPAQGSGLQQSQFQAVAAAPSAGVASGQLDQSTLDILRQLSSVPTSASTLLHESHQTLSNEGNNGGGGNSGYASAAPAAPAFSAPAAPAFSAPAAPAFSAPQPAPQQFSSAPQFSSPQASFAPSPADIAQIASVASGSASSVELGSTLQLAPQQQPAPAQPSGLYDTASFPDPVTTIHKHVYVHIPPTEYEEELPAPRVRAEPANNQKHVQILFIKAPAPPTPKPIEFPPLGTNEEKTLVYVLVKKPEQPDEIVPPQTPEPKVSKPDVFFIKYQGEKDQPQGYAESGAPAGASLAPASDAIVTTSAAAAPESAPAPLSAQPSSSGEQLLSSSAPSAPSAPGPSGPGASQAASDIPNNEQLPLSSAPSTPDREYIPSA